MSVSGIEAMGFTPYAAPRVSADPLTSVAGSGAGAGVSGAQGSGAEFGDMVLDGLDRLQGVEARTDKLAVQAATGDLDNIHDYTLAATEASVTAQLTVAVRNRAIEAFNEIMRMPVG